MTTVPVERSPLLTIGIPAYQRPAPLARLLDDLVQPANAGLIKALVIDDGSTPPVAPALAAHPIACLPGFSVLENPQNLGYALTFCRLFEETSTEYLMVMADDDWVVPDELPGLIATIAAEQPDFLSPQCTEFGVPFRGRANYGPIQATDFLAAASHAPGLVYRVAACGPGLARVKERVARQTTDALVYPQLLVLASLLAERGKCVWFPRPTAKEGHSLPPGILDAKGAPYQSLPSRWEQLKAIDQMLGELLKSATDKNAVQQMTAANTNRTFGALSGAIAWESPAYRAAFDRYAARYYAGQMVERYLPRPLVRALRRVFGR